MAFCVRTGTDPMRWGNDRGREALFSAELRNAAFHRYSQRYATLGLIRQAQTLE